MLKCKLLPANNILFSFSNQPFLFFSAFFGSLVVVGNIASSTTKSELSTEMRLKSLATRAIMAVRRWLHHTISMVAFSFEGGVRLRQTAVKCRSCCSCARADVCVVATTNMAKYTCKKEKGGQSQAIDTRFTFPTRAGFARPSKCACSALLRAILNNRRARTSS